MNERELTIEDFTFIPNNRKYLRIYDQRNGFDMKFSNSNIKQIVNILERFINNELHETAYNSFRVASFREPNTKGVFISNNLLPDRANKLLEVIKLIQKAVKKKFTNDEIENMDIEKLLLVRSVLDRK